MRRQRILNTHEERSDADCYEGSFGATFYLNQFRLWRREHCYLQSIEQTPHLNPIIDILSSEELISRNQHDPS